MKTTNWKDIAELIGIAAIVASLIFVGLQMRQSHEIALVTLYQMRADAGREVVAASMGNDTLQQAIELEDIGGGEQTYAHKLALNSYMSLVLNHFENSHFLYQRGFLPEERWRSDILNLTGTLKEPWAMAFWQEMKFNYRQSYVDAIDEALAASAKSSAER